MGYLPLVRTRNDGLIFLRFFASLRITRFFDRFVLCTNYNRSNGGVALDYFCMKPAKIELKVHQAVFYTKIIQMNTPEQIATLPRDIFVASYFYNIHLIVPQHKSAFYVAKRE